MISFLKKQKVRNEQHECEQERIIFYDRTQMNADNQDFKYFYGLVDGGDY